MGKSRTVQPLNDAQLAEFRARAARATHPDAFDTGEVCRLLATVDQLQSKAADLRERLRGRSLCERKLERELPVALAAADPLSALSQAAVLHLALRRCVRQLHDQQEMGDDSQDAFYEAALAGESGQALLRLVQAAQRLLTPCEGYMPPGYSGDDLANYCIFCGAIDHDMGIPPHTADCPLSALQASLQDVTALLPASATEQRGTVLGLHYIPPTGRGQIGHGYDCRDERFVAGHYYLVREGRRFDLGRASPQHYGWNIDGALYPAGAQLDLLDEAWEIILPDNRGACAHA